MQNAKMPDASSQIPEASQRSNNLLIEQIYKGGVPLFEERGTVFCFVVFIEKYISCQRLYITIKLFGRWRVLDVRYRTS